MLRVQAPSTAHINNKRKQTMGKNSFRRGFKNRPFYEKIAMPIEIFQKIRALTMEAEGEISGFGRTIIVDDGTYFSGATVIVKEFEVFNQVCNAAHTTLKSEDMTQMYVGVARAGGDPSQWNFWWHSHVNFDTGFSAEDDRTMTNITKPKNGQEGSVLVALCTNKHNDYDATIYKDGRRLMNRIPLIILPDLNENIMNDAKKIIQEKVTYESYKVRSSIHEFMPDTDFKSDISLDDDDVIIINEARDPEYPGKLSKNKRRKLKKYGNIPFQRQTGWSPRP